MLRRARRSEGNAAPPTERRAKIIRRIVPSVALSFRCGAPPAKRDILMVSSAASSPNPHCRLILSHPENASRSLNYEPAHHRATKALAIVASKK
jgi:hypothetical protein